MKSVFQDPKRDKYCYVCHTPYNLHCHHIFEGTANRAASEHRGFKIYLCAAHHNMSGHGIHASTAEGRALDRSVKQMAQRYYEAYIGTREEFINEFTRSYMEENE